MTLKKDRNGTPTEVYGMKIHPLANIVPMATHEEQHALEKSIKTSGQREEIVLYRGSIVDGRCRALACENLHMQVRSRRLPHKTPLDEVEQFVKDTNTRRNLTASQKAIIAYRECQANPSLKREDVCDAWGVNRNNYYAVKYLDKNRPAFVEMLYEGYKAPIGEGRKSASVQTVANYVKREIEQLKADAIKPEIGGFNPSSAIQTQAGKDWFHRVVKLSGGADETNYSSLVVMGIYASIADKCTH